MIKDLIAGLKTKWLEGSGPHTDVVISSRVRLARNIKNIPFPHLMGKEHVTELFEKLRTTISSDKARDEVGPLNFIPLEELNPLQRRILVEKHLISPEHAESTSGGVIFNPDQSISIMVKEEDHIRIQSILPALQLRESYRIANTIDDLMEENLDFAFHEKYGYLTACPTNVGTGMRASVMMHLPGLVLSKQVNRVLTALSQVGLVVRGLYGEGTDPFGNIFQLSNGTTIGRTEDEVITNLSSVIKQVIDQERAAREKLYNRNRTKLEDRVMRAKGILENSRLITSREALKLLSDFKLGIDLGIIKSIDSRVYYRLLVAIQPGYLQYTYGKQDMNPEERDEKRAHIIREILH